jgi:hypothetical protein
MLAAGLELSAARLLTLIFINLKKSSPFIGGNNFS